MRQPSRAPSPLLFSTPLTGPSVPSAPIGSTFETAGRERIPVLSILLNNFSMAIELKVMPVSTEKHRSTNISSDYAAIARAFGGYGERVTDPSEIVPAIRRGIEQTRDGTPALLEFITGKETLERQSDLCALVHDEDGRPHTSVVCG